MALTLPILIPLVAAALSLAGWRFRVLQRLLALVSGVALLASSVWLLATVRRERIVVAQLGDWPAPYGITLVADLLSAIMVLLAALVGLAVIVYSLAAIDKKREGLGYYPLVHILLMGVCGAFLTGDIFNLYVWFEVMLIASFVLLALGGERPQMEGAIKYVTLNLVASALFLAAVGILYGLVGTVNMADLSVKLGQTEDTRLVTAAALLFLVAFGIKAAIFPLYFWLPASYHVAPAAVSALFAGLLTKVGVYALIRVFTLVFVHDAGLIHTLLLVLAGLTMVSGVLGAVAQGEVRRILSFHIISQIGYMIMGLALFTPLALAGTVFYIAHHIVVKTNLFLIGGLVEELAGTGELRSTGGFYRAQPYLSLLFLIPALSLAGLPPLSGFFAKLALVKAGLEAGQYAIVATALAVGLLTLFSMTKIWNEVFWKPDPRQDFVARPRSGQVTMALVVAGMAGVTVLIGFGAGPLLALATEASEQLLEPQTYVEAVLGGGV